MTMHELVRPGLAYLTSVRDQTLRARAMALGDAEDHFAEAAASGDLHWRDLALLGVIGEAMQILEDLAYIGESFTGPGRDQIPRYVSATRFSAFAPTNFYRQIKKWSDDRLLLFGSLRLADGERHISLHEVFAIQLTPAQIAAIHDAEAATAKQMRAHLLGLAQVWDQFAAYFHAFKHGALVLGRDDFFLADEHGRELALQPSLSVWVRRRDGGEVCGDTNLTSDQVAAAIVAQGRIAHEMTDYLVEARLAGMEAMGVDDRGNWTRKVRTKAPWRFWLDVSDLAPRTQAELAGLGVIFGAA
jgi:hypothetical protein